MINKNSCAMLLLAVVSAVSWNTAVSAQGLGRSRSLKPKVTVQRVQTNRETTTRGKVRVPPPRRQPTSQKQGNGRRISVSELRKRLNALNNSQQSQSRKAGDKPTPQKNPELKSVCDQYRALIRQITKLIDSADSDGRDVEAEQLSNLKTRAEKDAFRHGCGYIYLKLKPQIQVMEGPFKAKK